MFPCSDFIVLDHSLAFLIHFGLIFACGLRIRVQFHSHVCLIFLTLLVNSNFMSSNFLILTLPFLCMSTENHLTLGMWVYFQVHYHVALVNVFVFMPVPCCLNLF
jgi:hypothetical protein